MARCLGERSGRPTLGEQDVVLTVPASFDEEARELTVTAAREAGLEKLTLLEEPAAAFYSWIANHLARSQKSAVRRADGAGLRRRRRHQRFHADPRVARRRRVDFTRTAVGKHLLLGGDNLDLTLAWLVESKLGKHAFDPAAQRRCGGNARRRRRRCCAIEHLKSVEITVLGAGSSLIGGTLKTEITREEALELALEGFLPFCELTDKPKEEEQESVPRAGAAVCFRPGDHAASGGVSGERGRCAARRDSVQRRILHSGDSAAARGRCAGELVRQAAGDFRESRSGSGGGGGRGVLLVCAVHRRGAAGARRFAAGVLHRRSDDGIGRDVPGAARRGRRRRRSSSIARICSWWRTSRCRSGCSVR